MTTSSLDYYQLLQVDPDAPQEIIVEAYWHLASRLQNSRREKHGLREPLDALNEAYASLSSPGRRKAYDASIARVVTLRQERARAVETRSRRSRLSMLRHRRRTLPHPGRPDYYALLYLDPSAEREIVDEAYSAARLLLGSGRGETCDPPPSAGELEEAHAVLADPARRAAYDASLRAHAPGAVSLPANASAPRTAAAESNLATSSLKLPALVSGLATAAGRAAGRALWWGLTRGARLFRRLISWAWPVARARSRQFATWAWPIVREWSRRLAAWAWLATMALARAAARAARGAVRQALAWWREQRTSAKPIEDWAVLSRLCRDLDQQPRGSSPGEDHLPRTVPQRAARLVVETGPQAGEVLELQGEPVTLGAGERCALRLADDDAGVEAEHARIWYGEGRFILRSLAKHSATLAGGRPVEWAALENGAEIQIGSSRIRFEVFQPDVSGYRGAPGPD